MSTISYNAEDTTRVLKQMIEITNDLHRGLKHLQKQFDDAHDKSNMLFMKAISQSMDNQEIQLRKITSEIESLLDSANKYNREIEKYSE